jgi:glycosyltransferase involved in cell wall biosynthesis
LEQCLHSVSSQTYHDIEHIIIDGVSTDTTEEIINRNLESISKYVSEPDLGLYDAINKGIKLASGQLIGILNSDDFFTDQDVIKQVVYEFENNDVQTVYADVDFIDQKSSKIVRFYSSKFFKPWMFQFGFQPAHPTFYTYRKNFLKYGLYRTDMKISGDFELLLRYLKTNNLSYKYINDTWVKMRTGGVSTAGFSSNIKLNKEILRACKVNGIYTNYVFVYSKYLFKWWSFIFIKR